MSICGRLRRARGVPSQSRIDPIRTNAEELQWRKAVRREFPSHSIVDFIYARAAEMEDADPKGASECRRVVDDCCDHIKLTSNLEDPQYLLGAVNNMRPLRRLAQNWADHPDYQPNWDSS